MMNKRGRGRPHYSRPGGQRYIPAITKSCGHGTRCQLSASAKSDGADAANDQSWKLLYSYLSASMGSILAAFQAG